MANGLSREEVIEGLREIIHLQNELQWINTKILHYDEIIKFAHEDFLPETVDTNAYEISLLGDCEKQTSQTVKNSLIALVVLLCAVVGVTVLFSVLGFLWIGLIADTVLMYFLLSAYEKINSAKDGLRKKKEWAHSEAMKKKRETEEDNKKINANLIIARNTLEETKEKFYQKCDELLQTSLENNKVYERIGLNPDYHKQATLLDLLMYLQRGRAETLEEAIELYENEDENSRFSVWLDFA